MTQAIASIQKDHQRFDALLSCFETILEGAANGPPANADLIRAIVDYIGSFMDVFHHPKEDEYLFRVMRRRLPDMESVLNHLREDHYQGRRRLDDVKEALENYERHGLPALAALREVVSDYAAFERQHISQEEREVLPMARANLSHEDWVEINAAFRANEDPLFSDNRQRRFELLFNTIEYMAPPPFGRGEAHA
ncbi:MAG: hemerythrin domain-containing protein [Alphaproteobacteria bacterium]|nr:hemerythrin domain-containing protein [Alphaproteobacteria bacterium]